MSMNMVKRAAVAATLAAVVGPMAMAVPAEAKGSDDVVARGACTNGATWKLKAKHDDARIEWESSVA